MTSARPYRRTRVHHRPEYVSPRATESQSPEMPNFRVPPFLSEGLKTCPTAALNAGVLLSVLGVVVVELLLQADRPSASTAQAATAVAILRFTSVHPFVVGIELLVL